MNLDFNKLKEFLYEKRNDEIFDNPDKLYKAFIKVEKDGKQSPFNYPSQLHLFYECAYRYHKSKNLQTLINIPLPFQMNQNISFEEFCIEMRKYQDTPCPSDILPNDNVRDRIIRAIQKLLKHNNLGGWTFIDFSTIESEKDKEDNTTRKIYLSIDNKDLHDFSLLLLKQCNELGIRYNFKINADDRYRRADNVVIYTSDIDFPKYIFAIESIKSKFPQIDFGKAHLLSYNYSEYIGVATNENSNSSTSHTENLCEEIYRLRIQEEASFEHFFENVKLLIVRELGDTISFCEESEINHLINRSNENSQTNKRY